MYCLQCNKETFNPKFCGRSCNAKYHNRNPYRERKNPQGKCQKCNIEIRKQLIYCKDCTPSRYSWKNVTIGDAKRRDKKQYTNRVRENARRIKFKNLNKIIPCQNCGYEKFVEICHIKAISSFPDDTLISVINDDSNILALCPNCHWEFDNGLIKIGENISQFIERIDPEDKCITCKRPLHLEKMYIHIGSKKPLKEQLEKDLKELNWTKIGEKYGVTANSVKKWAVSYGFSKYK